MEYRAKIIYEQREVNRKFWKYTFVDTKIGQEDYFYNNYRINYIPDLVGRLELVTDEKQQLNFFQSFEQDISEEQLLIQLETEDEQVVEKLDNDLTRKKKLELSPWQINYLKQKGFIRKEIANLAGVSERTIYRKLKKTERTVIHRAGRKPKVDKNILNLLCLYVFKNNTATLQETSDYIRQQTGLTLHHSTISRALKRKFITRKRATKQYLEQDVEKVKQFVKNKYHLLTSANFYSLDECGFNLGESSRFAWSRKGCRAKVKRPGKRGSNYTLILCIQNIKKEGIRHWELIKGGVNSKVFHKFITNLELPTNTKNYLLLDNARVHHASKSCRDLGLSTIKELFAQKNITPIYLPAYSPQLNPTELCFNDTQHYVEKSRAWTEEKLHFVIDKKMTTFQYEDLTKKFQKCLDYLIKK